MSNQTHSRYPGDQGESRQGASNIEDRANGVATKTHLVSVDAWRHRFVQPVRRAENFTVTNSVSGQREQVPGEVWTLPCQYLINDGPHKGKLHSLTTTRAYDTNGVPVVESTMLTYFNPGSDEALDVLLIPGSKPTIYDVKGFNPLDGSFSGSRMHVYPPKEQLDQFMGDIEADLAILEESVYPL